MKKATLFLLFVLFLASSVWAADTSRFKRNSKVNGYNKPTVCLRSNIRCVLKKLGNTTYWCLKSSIQRNMDARRTTTPIKKTRRENLGHCAQIIPIREEYVESNPDE